MREYTYFFKWLLARLAFVKRWLYEIKDFILYTKASRPFYKTKAVVSNNLTVSQYYNMFGRVLFGIKEIIALLTKNKIFKKSILLEGFDAIDYPSLYKKKDHARLWPHSPFVELQPSKLTKEDIETISDSYFLSYHDNNESSSEYTNVFQTFYCNNSKNIDPKKLANFRADAMLHTQADKELLKQLNLSFILTDHLQVLNKSFGYLKSYLKSIDLVLDYHRFSHIIDHDILCSISESFAGNLHTPCYRGQRLSPRLIYLASVISEIRKQIPFNETKRNVIVDIGGGFGHLGRLTHYYIPNSCYILVELEEMSCYGAYFLKYAFKDKKIALYRDIKDRMDNFKELTKEYDFIILPATKLSSLPDESVSLYIATSSVSELPESIAKPYVETMDRTLKTNGYIYAHTKLVSEEHTPDTYPHYRWNFKKRYLTISYKYHPLNWIQNTSPQWIGKKID